MTVLLILGIAQGKTNDLNLLNTENSNKTEKYIQNLREDPLLNAAALIRIREPAIDPLILALKNDNSSQVRSYAAIILGLLGDARAIDPLGVDEK